MSHSGLYLFEGLCKKPQTALELISWSLLVEKEKILSQIGFDKLPASDKLRLLFSKAGIPLALPPERPKLVTSCALAAKFKPESLPLVKDLVTLAEQKKYQDGPHALTEIRNNIIHPKKKTKILETSSARRDASDLGLWYLELVLLYIFGYQGRYANRLSRPRQSGETELVPWSLGSS